MKKNVYLCQVNHRYGNSVFLPYSVGLLQAYAQAQPEINDSYEFKELLFLREPVKDVVARMDNPDVFAASMYIWNASYTLALAKTVAREYPDCLIVLGGPHVPNNAEGLFLQHPFADILIHGEGEETFADVLRVRGEPREYYLAGMDEVKGISYKEIDLTTVTNLPRPRLNDLSKLPSPYLSGVFENALKDTRWTFQVTQETHRGCPYSCVFCDWGSNLMAKVKRFDDDRITAEYEWVAKHQVEMLYNADANYGMFERDVLLTEKLVKVKEKYGFPKKFRAAYAKNSGDRVFQVSKLLNDAGMSKGTTLSFQSLDDPTLVNIKRKNIDMSNFRELMAKYNAAGIPTYSELIVGMPGETYDTFADGIARLLDAGQHSGLNVYTAELLPNSEMSLPAYREEHGIQSVEVPQLFYHTTPADDLYREHYEIVTATKTLPEHDWLKCQLFSWAVQCLHCLGLTQHIARFLRGYADLGYRTFYEGVLVWGREYLAVTSFGKALAWAEDFFRGMQRGTLDDPVDLRFGNVSWPPEEFGFLKIVTERERFYRELRRGVAQLVPPGYNLSWLIDDLFRYQQATLRVPYVRETTFPAEADIHAFLQLPAPRTTDLVAYDLGRTFVVRRAKVYDSWGEYAREVVWYGRKGGSFLEKNVTVLEK